MMKRKEIPEWEHITDYRPFEEKSYEFDFSLGNDRDGTAPFEPTDIRGERLAALNYAREMHFIRCYASVIFLMAWRSQTAVE